MKRIAVLALLAVPALAQTTTTPTASTPTTRTATPVHPAAKTTTSHPVRRIAGATTGVHLPPGIPPVRGPLHTAFSLRYQDLVVGTGPEAEPRKLYSVKYTGWLAADGKKFDSSYDHPKGEPIQFPQGFGRVIPGWDQGFEGMKIGGKRRLFIPYQLAYGATGRPPVIPAKSDLIFDVELVDVKDMPAPPQHPVPFMPQHPAAPAGAPAASAPVIKSTAPAPSAPAAAPAAPAAPKL